MITCVNFNVMVCVNNMLQNLFRKYSEGSTINDITRQRGTKNIKTCVTFMDYPTPYEPYEGQGLKCANAQIMFEESLKIKFLEKDKKLVIIRCSQTCLQL